VLSGVAASFTGAAGTLGEILPLAGTAIATTSATGAASASNLVGVATSTTGASGTMARTGGPLSRYFYESGADGMVTVAWRCVVVSVRVHATNGGAMVITPHLGVSLPAVPIPAGDAWFEIEFTDSLRELVGGSTFLFAGTDSYVVVERLIGAA